VPTEDDDKRTHSVPLDTDDGEVVIGQENVGAGVEAGGGEFPDKHTPAQPPAPGATAGASSLTELTDGLERDGYAGQFVPEAGGVLRCLACGYRFAAKEIAPDRLCRVEGASDPADMAAVAALTCPRCHTKGTVVLKYGPDTDPDSADVLAQLERSAR
jgi:hypothetical protein